jgi:hypothetical protein
MENSIYRIAQKPLDVKKRAAIFQIIYALERVDNRYSR